MMRVGPCPSSGPRGPGFIALALVLNVAAGTALAQPDADRETARIEFESGVALFDEGNFAAALDHFRESFGLYPTPVALFNVGVCLQELGDSPRALDAFHEFLQNYESVAAPEDLADVRARIASIEVGSGTEPPPGGETQVAATVEPVAQSPTEIPAAPEPVPSPPEPAPPAPGDVEIVASVHGARIAIDGTHVGYTTATGPLPAGVHDLVVSADGFDTYRGQFDVAAGEHRTVPVELVPAPEAQTGGVDSGWFWTFLTMTAITGVGGTVTGAMTAVRKGDFNDARQAFLGGDLSAMEDGRSLAQEYDGYRLATNVLLPIAGALALTTIIVGVFTDFGDDTETDEAPQVVVGPWPDGLAIGFVMPF